MAITPLDLQMLLSQVDKLAKDVHAQKDGAALHKTIETAIQQRNDNEKSHAVHETESHEHGLDSLADSNSGGNGDGQKRKPSSQTGADGEHEALPSVIDPNLGKFIDLSG